VWCTCLVHRFDGVTFQRSNTRVSSIWWCRPKAVLHLDLLWSRIRFHVQSWVSLRVGKSLHLGHFALGLLLLAIPFQATTQFRFVCTDTRTLGFRSNPDPPSARDFSLPCMQHTILKIGRTRLRVGLSRGCDNVGKVSAGKKQAEKCCACSGQYQKHVKMIELFYHPPSLPSERTAAKLKTRGANCAVFLATGNIEKINGVLAVPP